MDWEWVAEFMKGMTKLVAALVVVLMAVALSYFQNLGLQREMIYSIFRAFVQLSVIGFVLQFIFNQKNLFWILLAYLFMLYLANLGRDPPFTTSDEVQSAELHLALVGSNTKNSLLPSNLGQAQIQVSVAGYTAGQRAKHVPRGKLVAGVSILAGTSVTMFLLVVLNVFPFTPRYIIPVAGMMVGNAMTVTGVTMKRLRDDLKSQTNLSVLLEDCRCWYCRQKRLLNNRSRSCKDGRSEGGATLSVLVPPPPCS